MAWACLTRVHPGILALHFNQHIVLHRCRHPDHLEHLLASISDLALISALWPNAYGVHRASCPLRNLTRIDFLLRLQWSTDCGITAYSKVERVPCRCKMWCNYRSLGSYWRTVEVSVEQLAYLHIHCILLVVHSGPRLRRALMTCRLDFECSVVDVCEASYWSQNFYIVLVVVRGSNLWGHYSYLGRHWHLHNYHSHPSNNY